MPIVVHQERGARGLYETSYDFISVKSILDLPREISALLKHNSNKNASHIFTIKGGPVYDPDTMYWYQAYVAHSNW